MKNISTLVSDIQTYLRTNPDFLQDVGHLLVDHPIHVDRKPYLRLSQLGPKCPCALWHSIHKPEEAEEMPPWANFKFSFGHIIEAAAIVLAKKAGHDVVGEQDELVLDGIVGHRDCVIDGCVVDVKSTTSLGFRKFAEKTIASDDSFGYLDQLDAYVCASHSDPLVQVHDRAYLLAIDKQLGHMCLYEHKVRPDNIRQRIADHKRIIALGSAPKCECGVRPDGKSGNYRLDTKASYSPFKHSCFPNLRTFIYSNGPVYLTQVARTPEVREVDRYGKTVYN